jgi:hypothetical protein
MTDGSSPNLDYHEAIYSHLNEDRTQIRVLRIQQGLSTQPIRCELQIVSINEDSVPFEALSYVWGKEHSPTPIFLCGQPYKVTSNLYSALQHLRKSDEEYTIWIDALCINQADPAERSSQVGLMQEIYCRATSVVAWLGEPDGPDDRIVLAMRIMEELWTIETHPEKGITPHWGQRMAEFQSNEAHVYTHLLGYCETFHKLNWPEPDSYWYKLLDVAEKNKNFDPHRKWPVCKS